MSEKIHQTPDQAAASKRQFEKMADTKLDQSPAFLATYEEHKSYLDKELDKLDPAKIRELQELADDTAATEEDQARANKYHDLQRVLGRLSFLQQVKHRDREIEKIAQSNVFEVARANGIEDNRFQEYQNAIHHLATAVDNLARGKFPKSLEIQERREHEKNAAALAKKREELNKMNIS